jgi:transposase
MTSIFTFVGLDYHQDTVRVCVLGEDGVERVNRDVPNDAAEIWSVVMDYGLPKVVALEACCGTADLAQELKERFEWNVKLADAHAVSAMKRGRDKTDKQDAFWLADLARVDHLPEVWLPDETTRGLRRLVRYRKQLTEMRRKTKQHVRGVLNEERAHEAPANPWTKAWKEWIVTTELISEHGRWVIQQQLRRLEQLDRDIREVEERMQQATAQDEQVQALLQHKGIGLVTAVTLRAELGTFERFHSGKQVARFCGVTPCNRSSGRKQADAGLIKQANGGLRLMMLEAAHRLCRWDPKWKELKLRLLKKGKANNVATAAVANRWLRWLYHQMVSVPKMVTFAAA